MRIKIWLCFSLILVLVGVSLAQTATKTVTNADLEKYRQKREQSEAEYRANYKERGMPSPEELEQRQIDDQRSLQEFSNKLRSERLQKQNYWQSQAALLRSQIASVNAQINYLSQQTNATTIGNNIFHSVDELNGLVIPSYGYGRGYRQQRQINSVNQATSVQTAINAAAAMPNPFYGTPLYQTGIKLVIGPNLPRRSYGRNYGYPVYYPYVVNNGNPQRDEAVSRLQYLGQVRSGLLVQWRNLVEDARRAGVRIN